MNERIFSLVLKVMIIFSEMSAIMQDPPRRESYSSANPQDRKASLREIPSYRAEASRALNRRDDLKSLSQRLSSNRDLLNADPSTKPWLKFRSISRTDNGLDKVREDAGQAFPIDEGTFMATPATITPVATTTGNPTTGHQSTSAVLRSRNLSRGTSSSADHSENNSLNDSFDH
jgi:hypothetical protein